MCLYVDDDSWEPLGDGSRKARKEHECFECKRVIESGERYQFWLGKSDGDFMEMKMCAHCWGTIELGSYLTGCPQRWFWDSIHEHDEYAADQGFVANILHDEGHELSVADKIRMLRTVAGRNHGWRRSDGSLLPIPAAPEKVGA